MSGTATIKAVTDGIAITTDTTSQADQESYRSRGLAHVWEQQIWYMTGLGESALTEARSLLSKILQVTSYSHRSEATEPLDVGAVAGQLREALDCLDIAIEHLSALNVAIRTRQDDNYTGGPMF
jgi:hypothetical protein